MDMQAFNEQIIDEFRANGGSVALFAGYPMVVLHTVGAKSGAVRLIPLVLTESGDERILFASFAGSKKDPAWVHNLRATPEIKIELADGTFIANVEKCATEEAASRDAHQVTVSEQFKAYVESAYPRAIPVFKIRVLQPARN